MAALYLSPPLVRGLTRSQVLLKSAGEARAFSLEVLDVSVGERVGLVGCIPYVLGTAVMYDAPFYIGLLCVLNSGICGEKHFAEFSGGCFISRQLVKSNENSS